jgi:hypothetical protein
VWMRRPRFGSSYVESLREDVENLVERSRYTKEIIGPSRYPVSTLFVHLEFQWHSAAGLLAHKGEGVRLVVLI